DFRKRAPEVGMFTQCDGDFPITIIEDTYTPSIFVPGEKTTEHFVWDSTVEIEPTTTFVLSVSLLDGTAILTHEEDYCESNSKPPDIDCPIPAGHLDFTLEYVFPISPTQPVNVTEQYLIKSTLIGSDGTTLLCESGIATGLMFSKRWSSFPNSVQYLTDFRKRAPKVGAFTQCDGNFPIVVTEDTYTPPIFVPGKKNIEHIVWDSTVEIEPKTTLVMAVTLLDGTPILTYEEDYCEGDSKPPDIDCPIPAGHHDFTIEYVVHNSPNQPVNETINYLIKTTLVSEGRTLFCVEGPATVAYP
ncbi:10928_t:CDS:2, partial [Entrophospora sp. SA101]